MASHWMYGVGGVAEMTKKVAEEAIFKIEKSSQLANQLCIKLLIVELLHPARPGMTAHIPPRLEIANKKGPEAANLNGTAGESIPSHAHRTLTSFALDSCSGWHLVQLSSIQYTKV